ncbi:MAG: 30S ribosomal protein S13 [Candidatus Lokiarchaeota archaeon]|nr:30S ribosomal protein S13 [Candidatus Lokiarchaeota archaeon]MBD3337879.1 30S ribosomal protein S13 [Candidatus Lokiarchaeota archaeon]
MRPKNFREQVFFRKLRTRVDGNARVEYGLTQIKGVGKRFAQAVVKLANIDRSARIGAIPEKDINRIEEIILNPIDEGIPRYLVNRCKDLRTGEDLHKIGNQLEITVKRDIDRMKRIRSYKGVRHRLGLKVRGQRTKSTGRHGLVIGVMRKRLKAEQAKKRKKSAEKKKE